MIMIATVSLEHTDFTIILPKQPEMEDQITIPLFGTGVVSGLNFNYKDTGETWVMIKFSEERSFSIKIYY